MSKIDKLNQSETSRMKKNIFDAFGEVNYLYNQAIKNEKIFIK